MTDGVRLIDALTTTPEMSVAFSDEAVLRAMLDFEVALATVQARLGVVPAGVADAIARAAVPDEFDAAAIARDARVSATPSIPFVKALTARVRAIDPASASWVHWGATSQDVFDTALVLCLTRLRPALIALHARLVRALVSLSDAHRDTVMLGRTLLQPAPPITFGLKAAGWTSSVHRTWTALAAGFDEARVLQFGGAAGTLAALGSRGDVVAAALADDLHLRLPEAPWHSHRDRLGALVCDAALYAAALAKMAGDIVLLMQSEVGEAAERGGGSSTMPHKRNPSASALVLAAAARLPGLASSMLAAAPQAHERGVGGWHAEAPTIAAAMEATGSALAAAVDAVEGLTVDVDRMRANLAATRGVVFAERLMFLLARAIGRERAMPLVEDVLAGTHASGRSLGVVAAATPAIVAHVSASDLATLDDPRAYLGSAEAFRRRLLDPVRASLAE